MVETLEEKIKVLEVDQWTSTGNITDYNFETFELSKVTGGDSEAARTIFGGTAHVHEVFAKDCPSIGRVWYIEDSKTKKFTLYKSNYDSSD